MPTMTNKQPLTERQAEVLAFITACIAKDGPPSFREIAKYFGMHGTTGVVGHLKALQTKGWITWEPFLYRSIRLTGMKPCPHCGGLGQIEV